MDLLSSIGTTINTVASDFSSKVFLIASATAAAFFAPIAGLIVACFLLNIADLITGLEVAVSRGRTLWSRKMWTGTIKKIRQESVVIILMHIIEYFAMSTITTTTVLSGGATVLICLTELWSILENLNTVNPDGPWKILGKFLKQKGQDLAGINLIVTKDGKLDIETNGDNVQVVQES